MSRFGSPFGPTYRRQRPQPPHEGQAIHACLACDRIFPTAAALTAHYASQEHQVAQGKWDATKRAQREREMLGDR